MSKKAQDRKLVSFDWAIKYLLRDKSDYVILEGFLGALFQQEIQIEEILESETNAEYPNDKQIIVDLLCRTKEGELVLIEVQFSRELDFFHRIIYGVSRVLSEQLKKGDGYHKVAKIYADCLVYFDLGFGLDYVYRGQFSFFGLHQNDSLSLSKIQELTYKKSTPGEIFPEFFYVKN